MMPYAKEQAGICLAPKEAHGGGASRGCHRAKGTIRFGQVLGIMAMVPAFLGGATERWSQGVVMALLGVILLVFPPRKSLSWNLNLILLGLLGCAWLGFLPANWFAVPIWRQTAVELYSIALPGSITPQPWVTAESLLVFMAALAWFYLACTSLRQLPRRVTLRWMCAALATLAALSIFFFLSHKKFPFVADEFTFGPFPNRNQMAALLSLGAVLTMGLAHEDFRRGDWSWVLWVGACLLDFWGLALAASRAGVILFFSSVILWVGALALVRRRTPAIFGFAAGFLLILFGAFLLGGGESLNRFLSLQHGAELTRDLRWTIQGGALELCRVSPVTGIGLGNFASQFWLVSGLGKEALVLHPESDWMWCAVELGTAGLVLILGGLGLLGLRFFPLGNDPDWRLRAAAGAGVLAFLLHGTVDVSGHRLGSVFPAILVGCLALRTHREGEASAMLTLLFRGTGILFGLVGVSWALAHFTPVLLLPGSIGAESVLKELGSSPQDRRNPEALRLINKALAWTPMDWRLYYHRAVASANSGEWHLALEDFRRARYLNPTTAELPFKEGLFWLETRPVLTLPAWQAALARAGGASLYAKMLKASAGRNSDFWGALLELAEGNSELMLTYLRYAHGAEFHAGLNRLLASDPDLKRLSFEQKAVLFPAWAANSDLQQFVAEIESREEWMPAAWLAVAECYARKGDYQQAWQKAQHFLKQPVLPQISGSESTRELQRLLYLNPQNFTKGFVLYSIQIRQNQPEEALATLQKLTLWPECPGYFHYLRAELLARSERWQEAWNALRKGGFLQNPVKKTSLKRALPKAAANFL